MPQIKKSFIMHKCISTLLFLISLSLILPGCEQGSETPDRESTPLNIVWLVTEDMGFYLPTFGDSTISTPNLSRLAAEGIAYTHLFSPSGVCAPSRAAIATGLYPSSFGANHMRTNSYTEERGMPGYEAMPPPEVKMMSEILRRKGYYCTNNNKEDYQFNAPATAWDESSIFAHWRNRAPGQPFFAIFNFTDTHESGLFEPYGHRNIEQRHYMAGDTSFRPEEHRGRMTEEETPVHVPRNQEFIVPPYRPNSEVVQRDMWKVYNNIAEMDRQVGAVLAQLEADGLMDNTVIFFYADHGGPLPRQKRLIYDSGLRSPMIIRFPDKKGAGTFDNQLLSFIDFAPTVLSLAGIEPPSYLHGQAFLGTYQAAEPRSFIHAAADRFDAFTDAIRAVRGQRYKYIRNYRPEQGYYLPVTYREQIPTMQELLRLRDAGQLTPEQAQWFREQKPAEELFDCVNDPHELHNLAGDPDYAEQLNILRAEMDRWLNDIGDQPNLPEDELLAQLWNGSSTQPVTADPDITQKDGQVTITCATTGASIGYQKIVEGKVPDSWTVYTGPFKLGNAESLRVVAHRIGFKPSEMIKTNPAD
jgi:arylsulfatase A-like enzyme